MTFSLHQGRSHTCETRRTPSSTSWMPDTLRRCRSQPKLTASCRHFSGVTTSPSNRRVRKFVTHREWSGLKSRAKSFNAPGLILTSAPGPILTSASGLVFLNALDLCRFFEGRAIGSAVSVMSWSGRHAYRVDWFRKRQRQNSVSCSARAPPWV